jgi:hypothetical protein
MIAGFECSFRKAVASDVGQRVSRAFHRPPLSGVASRPFQKILPDITAAGAALVGISPEKPDDTLSTAEKNALSFEVA